MHELGIVCAVIDTIDKLCVEQDVPYVDTVVLEVGELSGMVPAYIEDCYPAVTYNKERFKDSKLRIDVVEGEAKCQKCGEVFNVVANEGYCPKCDSFDKDVLSGLDFMIKEIIVPEEEGGFEETNEESQE